MSSKSSKGKPRLNLTHELFAQHMNELRIKFVRELPVIAGRRFRWDFAIWQPHGEGYWGVEIDGYHNGRHGAGWGSDNEKMNLATVNGWRFLRFSTTDVKNGNAKSFIAEHLLGRKA